MKWLSHFSAWFTFPKFAFEAFARTYFLVALIWNSQKTIHNNFSSFSIADFNTNQYERSFSSIDVTMDTKTANHILITTVFTTLAILANAAPASINHAEVSPRGIPFLDGVCECLTCASVRAYTQRSITGNWSLKFCLERATEALSIAKASRVDTECFLKSFHRVKKVTRSVSNHFTIS